MKKNILIILFSIILLLIIFLYFANFGKGPKEITIGALLPLTGQDAYLGEQSKRGLDLAIEKINSAGGIRSKIIKVIYEDSKGETNSAVSGLNKLIKYDKVPAVIGELSSTITLALAPIAEKNKIFLISPTASTPRLSNIGKYFFRVCASDVFEGTTMAEYAYNVLKIKKIGILFINNDYGIGLKDAFNLKYKELGGNVKIEEPFEPQGDDFRTQLMKIGAQKVEAIYLPGYAPEIGIIFRQARELGLDFKFLSSIDFENPKTVELAGNLIEGTIYTAYNYDPNRHDNITMEFTNAFKKKFNDTPGIYAALSYDSMLVLADALRDGTSPDKIMNRLYKIDGLKGVTGDISFDEDGNVKHLIVLKTYRNGSFIFLSN
jgi:branched-chain amino acid transport system substrate-binding protein